MSSSESEDKLINEIKQELDRSCDRLDGQTLSRLNHIRHQTLEGQRPFFFQERLTMRAVLASCIVVIALSFYFNNPSSPELDIALSDLEDIELLAADEDIDFYEDIEFYQWLSMADEF